MLLIIAALGCWAFALVLLIRALVARHHRLQADEEHHGDGARECRAAWGSIALKLVAVVLAVVATTERVPFAYAGVAVIDGDLQDQVLESGTHFLQDPRQQVMTFPRRRQVIDTDTLARDDRNRGLLVTSIDDRGVRVSLSLPWRIVADHAGALYAHYGSPATIRAELIEPAARAAIRSTAADRTVERITAGSGYAEAVQRSFARRVRDDLEAFGLSTDTARSAVQFPPVHLVGTRAAVELGGAPGSRGNRHPAERAYARATSTGWAQQGMNQLSEADPQRFARVVRAAKALMVAVENGDIRLAAVPGTNEGTGDGLWPESRAQ